MNKQFKIINGQKVNTKIEWCDYTWNPVQGCKHQCRWQMPDGTIAECYAETTANKFRSDKFMPEGFEHHYWNPDRLEEPLKVNEPSRIFLDSVSDLMGYWVPEEHINQVLDVCSAASHHVFQLLTKNAPRLLNFYFPSNVWVGVSAPPSFMFGKELSEKQQHRMVDRQIEALDAAACYVRWMSIEPLSFDIAPLLKDAPLDWVVVGAATNGRKAYQPERIWVENLLGLMDERKIPVFFKGNLKWDPWREEFPDVVSR